MFEFGKNAIYIWSCYGVTLVTFFLLTYGAKKGSKK